MRNLLSRFPIAIVSILVIIAALFMLNAARNESAIFDETAHIVAGYNYAKNLDYRFNPEHPPFVKLLAGIPLALQNFNFPADKEYWTGTNEQWWAGNEFLYKSGNDADKIIFWARIGPIILTLLLIIVVYIISSELMGCWWALLPAFLTAFSPIILAHGHYVTTDTGAALGILLAIYFFNKFLNGQTNKNLLWAGLFFGLAQSIKFSAVLLIPYIFIISFVFYLINIAKNKQKILQKFFHYVSRALIIIIIGYITVIYPLYLLTTWNYPAEKQAIDAQIILSNSPIKPLTAVNVWMSKNKFTKPLAEYLLGVNMVMQRSAGGNNAFFLGELSSKGWWYYFPLTYLMKETLPALVIVFIGGLLGFLNIFRVLRSGIKKIPLKFFEYLNTHFFEFSMIVFASIYWTSSMSSPLNIGVRHIIPTIPLFYILASGIIKKWFNSRPLSIITCFWERLINFIRIIFNFWIKTFLLSILIIWLILETFFASPHFLSYFNEFFGWQNNGFYYATDSNFDWGQDLKWLQKWAQKNLEPNEKIAVDYFGGGDPKYYLGNQSELWWSSHGNPKDEKINWLAISANTLQGAMAELTPGFYRNPTDEYRWLENPYNFTDRAGTSIFIYKL